MKTIKTKSILFLLALLLLPNFPCPAQEQSSRDIILRAMKDEMNRNISRLYFENMERPFFISYSICDAKTLEVNATLGSIVDSEEYRYRSRNVRVMVGDYSLNDENFQGYTGSYGSSMLQGSDRLPLEDDYQGIRRAFWISTDNTYKSAVELFEHKKAALEQQVRDDDVAGLEDFSRAPVVTYTEKPRTYEIKQKEWEKTAEKLSGVFKDYPDVFSSQVRIFLYQADMFFVNAEGTELIQPLTLAVIQINAYTQAVDGEPLSNHIMFCCSVPDNFFSSILDINAIHQ
ncbi:hypothetical protein ACFL1R_06475, partial [Candidatus Latescibacterota bacterium]